MDKKLSVLSQDVKDLRLSRNVDQKHSAVDQGLNDLKRDILVQPKYSNIRSLRMTQIMVIVFLK